MSAELLDTPISYEQLDDIEDDFEEVELELRKFVPPSTLSVSMSRRSLHCIAVAIGLSIHEMGTPLGPELTFSK